MAQDPYKYFRIEAHEIVGDLAKGLLDLEKTADAGLVARLLRQAHTLKGAARIVRHRELADLAHELEDVLAPLREAPRAQRHDPALAIVDRMAAHLKGLGAPAKPVEAPRPDDVPPVPRVDATSIDDALTGLASIQVLIGRSRAADDPRTAARYLEHADRELREVRKDVEQLRLSAAGTVFTSLERVARDAAIAQGKRVAFSGRGTEVRVDAHVLATLHGALVQLVRNAVVHGIEPPAERAGKPADGRIAVTASSLGRRVSLTCEDDGRGLDLAAIRRAAERRGLPDVGDDPSQLFQLLLGGGISTSRDLSPLAGRGIGLDVVRDATARLGGEVTVRTQAGAGTAISLVVPVTISAMTVVRVDAGGRIVAIPQPAVRSVSRVRASDLVTTGGRSALYVGDVAMPCVPLATLVGGAVSRDGVAVVIDGDGELAAISVDRVIGIDDAVVRDVPPGAPIDEIVSGMAIDAEGRPYAVLEPRAVVAAASTARAPAPTPAKPMSPILIVDDSLTTRMLEQSILESAGFEVDLATSAEEALDKLARGPYALLLVDVEMPGMDGFSLISTIRSRPALAHLPAILVTSRDAPEDKRRGAAVGAQGYVVKSHFEQRELLAMIRKLVQA